MASLHHNRISLGSITRRYIKILAAVSMPPAILLLFITPSLFSFLFGQQWYEAGQYARWLIPWGVSSFCNAPCQIAAQVLRLQKLLLNFEIVIFFSRSLVFLIALKLFSPVTAIAAWSVTSALMNTLQIISILSKTESILKNK
jgi:O-antigen/teichoic acid export membrane protein